jgi:hypothetical protein
VALQILFGVICAAIALIISTSVRASIVGVIEAEMPLLEMLLVGTAAGASLAVLWCRQRISTLRTAFEMSMGPVLHVGRNDRARSAPAAGWVGSTRVEAHADRRLSATSLRLSECDPKEWDAFAQACHASYRSAHPWLKAWALKRRFQYQLKLVELRNSGRRVGQCAVAFSSTERIFLDRLQLSPDADIDWADAMATVLAELGPGYYRYGWHLNLEQSREQDLRRIPGTEVESVQPLTVHAVDFRQWESWDAYWKSTSNNTRRNAKKADAEGLKIEVLQGLSSLRHVAPLVRLRSLMYERKGIQFRSLKVLAGSIVSFLASPKYNVTALVCDDEQPLAGFSGMEFGTHTYYLDGGSRPANKGAAWYLQRAMLQRAWERHPREATFIMGYVDFAIHDEAVGGGLLRSRKAVRAADFETSVVSFSFQPQESRAREPKP